MNTGIIVALAIVVVVILWYVASMNSIRALEIKVKESNSGIDVALTKRYDVLTKQLAVVKEYASHESKTLYETIKLRSGMSMAEKQEANSKMDALTKQFYAVGEAYPELLSSNNFKQLQAAISDVEEHLQAARRLYNANVTAYNTKIVMFPTSIVAGAIGATQKEMFVAEEYKREDVAMSF